MFANMDLQTWRSEKKLTQAEAAGMLGIPQPTISRIERGEIWPGPETISVLSEKSEGAITADDLHASWKAARAGEDAA